MSSREFTVDLQHRYRRGGPVRWISSHILRYPLLPLGILLSAIFNNIFYSYTQVYIGRGFDVITTPGWTNRELGLVALAAVAIVFGQGLFGLARNYTAEFLAQRVERDSRQELYAELLGKDQTFHNRQRVGDIMARATDDVRSLNFMINPGLMLITDAAMGIITPFVVIATLDPRLLLVPSLFLVGLIITLWNYNQRLSRVNVPLRNQFGVMNAGLTEAIAGIEVVKGNVQERHEWDKFTHNASRYRDLFIRQGEIQAFYLPTLVFAVAFGGAFAHSLLLWYQGEIALGTVIAYMGLIGVFRFSTFVSIFSFNLVQLGIASSRRILEIINAETELDQNVGGYDASMQGAVTFENVSFGYGPKPILKEISFRVAPGEVVAIVGQTGSGKTTMTRLINRIFDAGEGRVLVDGVDVREWDLAALRSQISTIEQDVFLFSRSVAENIAFGRADAAREEIEAAARAAQAHDFITGFADGYQSTIGERGVTLSGGQRQRLAIARAFLVDPRILILDDSTSAIDSATEDRIQRAMRRISAQRTTFLITHRLSQIRWADRILLLQDGALVDQGTHEELLARSADYRQIFARL